MTGSAGGKSDMIRYEWLFILLSLIATLIVYLRDRQKSK